MIGTGRFANNTTILNGPKFRITIPAGEVRSIKQGTKPCIAVLSRRYSAFQKTEPDKTNDDQQQILHGPELEQRKEEAKKADKAETESNCSRGSRNGKEEVEPLGIKGFDDLYNDLDVKFILYMDNDYYEDIKADSNEFEKRFKLTTTWRLSNMTCFDNDMRIVKYSCIGDMMEAFYGPRLEAYEKRRVNEMARLEREALEADAKARFLRAVLEGDIDLRKATDEEIVQAMVSHSLPPLSDPEDPETVDAYEYLLRLRMDRVKASAIEDAEKSVIAARMAYETLRDTTASALWLDDLDDFEEAWSTMQSNRESIMSGGGAIKKRKSGKKA